MDNAALSPAPRPQTGKPVFGLVVGVPEPSVDMGTLIVRPTPLFRRYLCHRRCIAINKHVLSESLIEERRKEMFYLLTYSTPFIYGY